MAIDMEKLAWITIPARLIGVHATVTDSNTGEQVSGVIQSFAAAADLGKDWRVCFGTLLAWSESRSTYGAFTQHHWSYDSSAAARGVVQPIADDPYELAECIAANDFSIDLSTARIGVMVGNPGFDHEKRFDEFFKRLFCDHRKLDNLDLIYSTLLYGQPILSIGAALHEQGIDYAAMDPADFNRIDDIVADVLTAFDDNQDQQGKA